MRVSNHLLKVLTSFLREVNPRQDGSPLRSIVLVSPGRGTQRLASETCPPGLGDDTFG